MNMHKLKKGKKIIQRNQELIYSSGYPACILEIIEEVLFNFFLSKSTSNSTKKVIRKPNLANLFHRDGVVEIGRFSANSIHATHYLKFR